VLSVPLLFPLPLPGAPHIRRGGTITLVSGGNAVKPGRNTTQAAAVNGAIESLGRALAGDLATQGIRVNVLSPGVVWTDLQLRVSFCGYI
jgi:NAD(P)-dependent dehydrogenase (short-subunit alcohol dehydrogenase family)